VDCRFPTDASGTLVPVERHAERVEREWVNAATVIC